MDFSMSAGQFPFRSSEKSQSALVPKNKSAFSLCSDLRLDLTAASA